MLSFVLPDVPSRKMKKNIESLQKDSKGHRDFSLRGWI